MVDALALEHAVDVLVVRDADQAHVERLGAARVLRVPTPGADVAERIEAYRRALLRQLEGGDYDIVHCADGWSGAPVLEARGGAGHALVFDLTRAPWFDPTVAPELAVAHERDSDACIAGADLVLVPTEPARRHALAHAAPERVALAPPGVDVDRFDWDEPPPAGAPPQILYAGPLEPGRGVRTLLRAMADVARAASAELRLVGALSPDFAAPLHAAIRDLGLERVVRVEPAVAHEAMPRLIAEATVAVVPAAPDLSPRATALYPTKLLELMACRRAIVTARRATTAMILEHGEDALLFSPEDPADLARKLLRLLTDPDQRAHLAGRAYDKVRRDLTAAEARRRVRAAYRQLEASRRAQDVTTVDASVGFVAGVIDMAAAVPEPIDDEGVFTAISPLLGSRE